MAAPKTSIVPKARPRTKTKEKTLRGRPVWIDHTGEVTGKKGTKYSEITTTIPWGTEWITAPSVDKNGKRLSDDEVKQRLLETRGKDFITGEELPTFSNPEKASEYAQWRSDTMFDQEAIEQGFPEEFPMGPEPKRKDLIDRSIDKGKDFLEYLTTPSKHGVFNEGGDVGLPSNRLVYDVDDITRRGPEGKIKRDAAKKRVLEKYNLEGARSDWKVSPSKLGTILANLPTNVRLLTEFMLGKDKPISINDFTKDELASIIALSEEQQENYKNVQNRKLKNQPENVTTVDGYDTTQPYRFSKWIENSPYFRTLAFTLTDPNYQTRTTLGRYDTEETPSSIIIKDAYDMNIKQRDLPNPFGGREELSKVLEEVRSNPEVAGEFLANIIKPNPEDSRKFDLVIPKRKPDQPSPRDTAYQAPMQLEEKPKDNPRVKEKVPEGFDILDFNKGGVAMNEQMEMAFMQEGGLKDDGMRQDPVSGNEVPSGSMASEVRDDIPAQLSEGEYVVPADVVRFFGVKFFEDLRTEAKIGLQSMEANGRIGGEPVATSQEETLSDEEFKRLLEQEFGGAVGMNEGGLVFDPMQYVGLGSTLFGPAGKTSTITPVETEASCAARGMILGPNGVCIMPTVEQVTTEDTDNDPAVPVETAKAKPWYEGDPTLFTDPSSYIEAQLGRGEMFDNPLMRAGALMAGPLGLVAGAASKIGDIEGIARSRAALEVARATGSLPAEEIERLQKLIDRDVQGNLLVDQDGKGFGIATGQNYLNDFAKSLGFSNWSNATEQKNKPEFQRSLVKFTDGRGRLSGGLLEASKIKKRMEKEGPTEKQKEASARVKRALEGSKSVEEIAKTSKPPQDDRDDGPSAAEIAASRASAQRAADRLGVELATGGRATGGLVSKPKKKK